LRPNITDLYRSGHETAVGLGRLTYCLPKHEATARWDPGSTSMHNKPICRTTPCTNPTGRQR
jgi:hypothetical protein